MLTPRTRRITDTECLSVSGSLALPGVGALRTSGEPGLLLRSVQPRPPAVNVVVGRAGAALCSAGINAALAEPVPHGVARRAFADGYFGFAVSVSALSTASAASSTGTRHAWLANRQTPPVPSRQYV